MAVKNSLRFAEIERLMGDYFGCHLAPVMGRVQRDLSNRQADEMRAYSNSTAGILRSLATANMPGDEPYATLRITGEWNSKTTEDYLAMCKEAIVGNKDMQRDFAVMAEEWRKAVVTEIGRERYDALSKQLGCDLAYAYIDHRMEQLMIEKLVKDRMPKSSADYIIRKAAQSSLFGLPYELNKSPLAAEIETRGEAAYKPSRTEKAVGWAAGAGADAVAMGGIGSWATFAKFVGIDMVMNVGMEHLSKKRQQPRGQCRGVYQQRRFWNGHQRLRLIPQASKGHHEPREQLYQGYQQPFQEQDSHEQYHIYGLDETNRADLLPME